MAFHTECYAHWGPSQSMSRITFCDFGSPPQLSPIRSSATIDSSLNEISSMPIEVCRLIGAHLQRTFSAAWTSSICCSKRQNGRVDTCQDIWAYFVKFRGSVYVSKISNNASEPIPANQMRILIYRHTTDQKYDVFTAVDSWGIRSIMMRRRGATINTTHNVGVWWEKTALEDGVIHYSTDVCYPIPKQPNDTGCH